MIKSFDDIDRFNFKAAFSPDGMTIISVTAQIRPPSDDALLRWNTKIDAVLHTFSGQADDIHGVNREAFSPDGHDILIGTDNGAVQEFNVQDGTMVQDYANPDGSVYKVTWSSNNPFIAGAASDDRTLLWDTTGTLLQTLRANQLSFSDLAFSPDGKTTGKTLSRNSDEFQMPVCVLFCMIRVLLDTIALKGALWKILTQTRMSSMPVSAANGSTNGRFASFAFAALPTLIQSPSQTPLPK